MLASPIGSQNPLDHRSERQPRRPVESRVRATVLRDSIVAVGSGTFARRCRWHPWFEPTRPGLVLPSRIDPAGLDGPTYGQARGPRWRRCAQGWYVPAGVDGSRLDQRLAEVSVLLRPTCALTGWASLGWRGGRWFTGRDAAGGAVRVPVATRRHLGPHATIQVSQEFFHDDDVELVDGLPLTTAVRSVCFAMRQARDVDGALVVLEMAAYDDLVAVEDVRAYLPRLTRMTGVQQVRDALCLAVENSWSPMETITRSACIRYGRTALRANVPVFDLAGNHVATPDLFDPEDGVAVDYDSLLHLVGSRRTVDVGREAALRAVGVEHVVALPADRADGFHALSGRLDEAYGRASLRPDALRRWTTTPPRGWVDTSTVAARRALTASQRDRLLRYRRPA